MAEGRASARREHKGLHGKSTVARICAIVPFNDSFRDRSGIVPGSRITRLFDCLHGQSKIRRSRASLLPSCPLARVRAYSACGSFSLASLARCDSDDA